MTSIRIGSPPSAPPEPANRQGLYALLAGVVLLLAAVGAVLGVVLGGQHQPQAAPPASASPTDHAPGGAISELTTCVALVPLLQQSANEMTALYGDPARSTADMASTAAALREVESKAPDSWRADIAIQHTTLQKAVDAKGDLAAIYQISRQSGEWSDAGIRLAEGCRPYATS